jgi:hypothetical protein
MSELEIHVARADGLRAKELAASESPFTIEVRFLGGLSDGQKAAFAGAADRWARMIVGDLPEVVISDVPGLPEGIVAGETIDDLVIAAKGAHIDGAGTDGVNVLGQARPILLRTGSMLPVVGEMTFDSVDLDAMERNGTLPDVIAHEMGHTLGFGRGVWQRLGLVTGLDTTDPQFIGPTARAEFKALLGGDVDHPVPVENVGGLGSAGSHLRESVFGAELMSSRVVAGPANPLSRVTVGVLADMGYQVDMEAAEPYELPSQLALAEIRASRQEVFQVCSVDTGTPITLV